MKHIQILSKNETYANINEMQKNMNYSIVKSKSNISNN